MSAKISRKSLTGIAGIAMTTSILAFSGPARACGTDAYLGQVCSMAIMNYCPAGTEEAVGQLISTSENPALFALLGCEFGGDCRSTFRLPDLRGRVPVGYGVAPGLDPHPFAQPYGREYTYQSVDQMPPHSHTATFTPSGGGGGGGTDVSVAVSQDAATTDSPAGGKYLAKATTGLAPIKIYNDGTNLTELEGVSGGGGTSGGGTVEIGETGGGESMPIAGPRLAMRYCIVTEGIWPPRS
ncbi:MAG: phage tail protein [Thalassospira sp.]|uniref:phage tail protein n=1 Tax=Thalassospira sp. TaxID=1912094 RepID=UPI000C5A5EFF|nr:tail fiber protein [Thalassospira sp.]MAZ31528.1 phage tail protein [Thalassospira sp.]